MKNMLKKIYKKYYAPLIKILYKPIFDEIDKNSIDKTTIYGIEALLRKELMPAYSILSPSESIKFLSKTKSSFIRFGDGDLPILCDKSGGMHKFSTALKHSLIDILNIANYLKMPIGLNANIVKRFNIFDSGFFYGCETLNAYGAIKYLPSNKTYFDGIALRYSPLDFYLFDDYSFSKINADFKGDFQIGGGQNTKNAITVIHKLHKRC